MCFVSVSYQADIKVAIKGANQLNSFRQKLNATSKSINKVNQLLVGRGGKGGVFTDYINGVKLAVRSTDNLNRNLSTATRNFNKVALDTRQAFFAAKDYVRAQDEVNRALAQRNKLINEAKRSLAFERFAKGDVSGRSQYSSPIGPRRAPGATKGGRTGRRGMMSGFSGTKIGQAVLGGGFPLLFGGGPGTVTGGVIGGLAGGFAGGIGGSIIGGAVDRAVASVAKLGQALNPLTADIDKLAQAVGIVGTAEAQRLKVIEQVAGKQAALKAASDLLEKQIGSAGVQALKTFGEDFQTLGNEFSRLFTAMGASLATFINNSGALKALIDAVQNRNLRTQAFNNQDPEMQRLVSNVKKAEQAVAQESINPTMLKGTMIPDLKERARLEQVAVDARKAMNKAQKESNEIADITISKTVTTDAIFNSHLEKLQKEGSILKEKLKNGDAAAEIKKLELDLQEKLNDENFEFSDKQKEALINAKNLNDETNKTIELFKQIKTTIATGITNAIKGLIEGTKTLGESLSAIAKQIADLILQKAILSAVDKVFTFGSGGVTKGSVSDLPKVATAAQGAFFGNGIRPFSTGGITTRPTLGLIGEAGESEYIIPASKMASSMQRYSAGARGDSVVAGGGSSYAGGGGGSSTTVSYSGPILNFNSEEFVPKSAVNDIIGTATRQGALQGSSQTFASLRNSRSARSRIGL